MENLEKQLIAASTQEPNAYSGGYISKTLSGELTINKLKEKIKQNSIKTKEDNKYVYFYWTKKDQELSFKNKKMILINSQTNIQLDSNLSEVLYANYQRYLIKSTINKIERFIKNKCFNLWFLDSNISSLDEKSKMYLEDFFKERNIKVVIDQDKNIITFAKE